MKNIYQFFLAAFCFMPLVVMGHIGSGNNNEIPPTIITETLPDGAVGTAYTHTLTADGDTPITWTLEDGNLPSGFSLTTNGIIYGYPTTDGVFNFTVKAQNSAGYDTKALSITIFPEIYIAADTLPNGTVGVFYEQSIKVFGLPLIKWSLESGNLPPGLSLNTSSGSISGIPTTEGTFDFTIKASNSAGFDTKELSITVVDPQSIVEKRPSHIVVFPNPTSGELRIMNYELRIDKIEVLDLTGSVVSSHHLIISSSHHLIPLSSNPQIDISNLNSGIYFIYIVTEQGAIVKKVIKQ
ncbi:MAG: putative Ig domain-containing protein [Lentimicrobiaceae bacterium]|nr:putative Ig domain-containing protein [Lentimicrobiaceae bacterium]